jgi:hypothetical protein
MTSIDVDRGTAARTGYLSLEGPATLRWTMREAAHNASRGGSPDHADFTAVKNHHDGTLLARAPAVAEHVHTVDRPKTLGERGLASRRTISRPLYGSCRSISRGSTPTAGRCRCGLRLLWARKAD